MINGGSAGTLLNRPADTFPPVGKAGMRICRILIRAVPPLEPDEALAFCRRSARGRFMGRADDSTVSY